MANVYTGQNGKYYETDLVICVVLGLLALLSMVWCGFVDGHQHFWVTSVFIFGRQQIFLQNVMASVVPLVIGHYQL
jgi:hypothetical protein